MHEQDLLQTRMWSWELNFNVKHGTVENSHYLPEIKGDEPIDLPASAAWMGSP